MGSLEKIMALIMVMSPVLLTTDKTVAVMIQWLLPVEPSPHLLRVEISPRQEVPQVLQWRQRFFSSKVS